MRRILQIVRKSVYSLAKGVSVTRSLFSARKRPAVTVTLNFVVPYVMGFVNNETALGVP